MKLSVVVEIVVMCCIITILCVFTVGNVMVRRAELQGAMATEVSSLVEDYFDGDFATAELDDKIKMAVVASSNSVSNETKVTVFYADAEMDVVDVLVEVTYTQPNGSSRTLSDRRVYIKDVPAASLGNPAATPSYSFIRNIDAKHFKTSTGAFVSEDDGGVKEDSVWRTDEYASILTSILK